MNREEFQTERTRIISEMLDNPDEYGIYPTTKCFEQLDALFDSLSLPPAEGAEAILKEGLDDGRYADIVDGINIDVKQPFYQAIIRYAEDVVAAQQQPTAEDAEEYIKVKHPQDWDEIPQWHIDEIKEFATLHAQRIAEKMVEERMEQYRAQFKDRPNPLEVNPYDSKGIKRIRNRKIH